MIGTYEPKKNLTTTISTATPERLLTDRQYIKRGTPMELLAASEHLFTVHFLAAPTGQLDMVPREDVLRIR